MRSGRVAMSRDQLTEARADREPGESALAAAADHGLPPALHARVNALGPGDAQALSELVTSHSSAATRILAAASRTMGLAAVQRAIATVKLGAVGPPSAGPALDAGAAPQPSAAPAPRPAHDASAGPTPEPSAGPTSQPAPGTAQPGAGTARRVPAPPVPSRPDNGGPGSRARRVLAAHGTADEAFELLASDSDPALDKNLADYGALDEQRALLDAVIAEGGDAGRVRRAFHAYWRVQLVAAGQGTKNVRDWPVATLQAIHDQLKLLPNDDARAGTWKKLSLSDEPRKRGRGWYDPSGDFAIGADARDSVHRELLEGYFEALAAPAKAGEAALQVRSGERFKAGDGIVLGRGKPSQEVVTVATASGHGYTLAAPLQHDHLADEPAELDGGPGLRSASWLDYTVRHEIAHSLDGSAVDTRDFYARGGWATFPTSPGGFDDWAKAMGGEAAWTARDGSKPSAEDRLSIKGSIMSVISSGGGSVFDRYRGADPPFPITAYEHKGVPLIDAAQRSLKWGDNFVYSPTDLHAANGKRFSISLMYDKLQYCSEAAVTDRVSAYSLTAPAEFFADAYAMFYEEAGKPGITDADHGRLIRNADWRDWLRKHVHDRGHGPAGTGAARPAGGGPGDADPGARPQGARRGKASGDPGM